MSTEDQRMLRKDQVLSLIADGTPKHQIINKIKNDYDLSESTARKLYNDVLEENSYNEKEREHLRNISLLRSEAIFRECMKEKKLSVALRAIDTMNKTAGLYNQEESKTEESDYNISFE